MDIQVRSEPRTDAPAVVAIDGVPAPALSMSALMAEWIRRWELDARDRLGTSDLERKKAKAIIEEVCEDLRWREPADLRRSAVLDWLGAFIAGGRSKKTAKNHLSRLRSFGDYLVAKEELAANPFDGIKLPRGRRGKGARAFAAAEVRRLIEVAQHREATSGRAMKHGPIASTFYTFLAHTGLRHSEARRQAWNDIDLDAGSITMTGDKAERGDTIALSAEAVDLLDWWRRDYSRGDRLFPHAPSHHTLTTDMAAAMVDGIDDGKRGQWHRFRKCAVTERARAGADVRVLHKFSRHTDASLTLGVYDDLELAEMRKTAELFPSIRSDLTKRPVLADDVPATPRKETDAVNLLAEPIQKACPYRASPSGASLLPAEDTTGGRAFPLGSGENGAGGNRPTGPSPRLQSAILGLVESQVRLVRLVEWEAGR